MIRLKRAEGSIAAKRTGEDLGLEPYGYSPSIPVAAGSKKTGMAR